MWMTLKRAGRCVIAFGGSKKTASWLQRVLKITWEILFPISILNTENIKFVHE